MQFHLVRSVFGCAADGNAVWTFVRPVSIKCWIVKAELANAQGQARRDSIEA